MTVPALSIVIPTHGRPESLRRLLCALDASTTPSSRFEAWVVADGCSDDALARIRAERPAFSHQVLALNPGRGAGAARNLGAAHARAPVVLFLDDDIEPGPQLIAEHLRLHEQESEELAVVGAPLPVRALDAGFDELAAWSWWEDAFAQLGAPGHRLRFDQVFSGVLSVSAERFRALGGFDERLRCREDLELGQRWLASGARVRFSRAAGGRHHELRSRERLVQRKLAEGAADVTIARTHPELWPALRLALPVRGAANAAQRLALAAPALARAFEALLGALLSPLERLRWRGTWRKLQAGLMHSAYWRGVASALEGGGLDALARACERDAPLPEPPLALDLRDGLEAAERALDRMRPSAARLCFGTLPVGDIPAVAGAERLRGAHLRRALAGELSSPLLDALALAAAEGDSIALDFATPSAHPGLPPVSVLIPAFDAESTLAETLASLQSQTHRGWEAIVVDDGSRDRTAEIAASFAVRDARIRVVRQRNRGEGGARNAAIAVANHDWLLFLDGDDTLEPCALERLVTATRPGNVDAVHGAWARMTRDGVRLSDEHAARVSDLSAPFAHACVFPIHACLVSRALTLRAGPFDETLRTCADWDFWQRVAQLGARFGWVPERVALYRMRPGSAASDLAHLLGDGLRVIAQGQERFARLADEVASARSLWSAWVAGMHCARGEDPLRALQDLPSERDAGLNPHDVADRIFRAGAVADARGPDAWDELWTRAAPDIRRFLNALEERSGAPFLARRAERFLEQRTLEDSRTPRPFARGATLACVVDAAEPLAQLAVGPQIERAHVRVEYGGRSLGSVMVAVLDGAVSVEALADEIATRLAWQLLGALFAQGGYRELALLHEPGGVLVRRGGVALAPPLPLATAIDASALHDQVGWNFFLQELWGLPTADGNLLYATDASAPSGAEIVAVSESFSLEVSDAIPDLAVAGEQVELRVSCGGAFVGRFSAAARDGWIRAPRLIGLVNFELAIALSHTAVRELLLAPARTGSLRERLALAARERRAGRLAAPTPPVQRVSRDELGACVARLHSPAADARSYSRHHFESLFAKTPDPWSYETSFEALKYAQTLELAAQRPITRALELACAEGRFTLGLAAQAREVLAADISTVALERAARRCSDEKHVRLMQLDLFRDPVPGAFDLIVCSEVLYYANGESGLRATAEKLARALAPGGRLVLAHTNVARDDPREEGLAWDVPFGAKRIGEILAGATGLRLAAEWRSRLYRIHCFERAEDAASSAPQLREIPCGTPAPHVAARFRRERSSAPSEARMSTSRLPILMYHRIAPSGALATARYRVTPSAFEEQLAYLCDAGFVGISLRDWLGAVEHRTPLPGRCFALTFDDGFADFESHALPILTRYRLPASIFVVGDRIGATNDWDSAFGESVPLLDAGALRRIAEAGVSIGAHAATHTPFTALTNTSALAEAVRAKRTLEELLGRVVDTFAYPHGDHDAIAEQLVRRAGYALALSCRPGPAGLREPRFALPRIEIGGEDGLASFVAKLGD